MNGRQRIDPIPQIRTAGKVIDMGGDSTAVCMKNEDNLKNAPGTPEHIRKYRKSFQNQPGIK